MMKSKNQNNKKRRSTVLKKIVGQEAPPRLYRDVTIR